MNPLPAHPPGPVADPLELARISPAFSAHLTRAIRDSGAHTDRAQAQQAHYRLVGLDGRVEFDLHYSDWVNVDGDRLRLADLIDPYLAQDLVRWILQVWVQPDLASLKDLLRRQRAIVRYARTVEGTLDGHVIPAARSVRLMENLERGIYFLDGGELVLDAITRMLGLRAKVAALYQEQRRGTPPPSAFGETLHRGRR